MSLKAFIDRENKMLAFMGLPQIEIDKIDDVAAQKLFQSLDSAMSPEALFMDGERTRAQAAKFEKMYKAAWAELKAKGFLPKGAVYNMTA